jgi:hypothetical protein
VIVTRYCYLVTEGAQDIAFLMKLLKYDGIEQVVKRSEVDPFWDDLIPKTFPYNDELNRQVPVPKFLKRNDLSIALQGAVGDTRIITTIQEDLSLIPRESLVGIGIILDADNGSSLLSMLICAQIDSWQGIEPKTCCC